MTDTVGLFSIDRTGRTLRGLLLPYGVKSKGTSSSKTAPITFPRGNVAIPRDPMVVGLNDEHERFHVIGRADVLEDTDAGVLATFALADTDRVDAWLTDHGDTVYLSAEIAGLRRLPGDIGIGELAGAAVTTAPAFDGTEAYATFSLIGDELEDDGDEDEDDELEDDELEHDDPATAEPTDEPAAPAHTEGDTVADAVAPTSMHASRRRPAGDSSRAPALTRAGFFSALDRMRRTGDRTALAPYIADAESIGLFALTDIKFDGTGGLLTDAGFPGAWLGELWTGKRFQRRIVPLLTQKPLTAMSMIGWVWGVKPAMAAWAGSKAAVPSNAPTVTPKNFGAVRYAGAHDLAREFYDFHVTEVIDSYADAMIDSYAMLSDAYALTQVTAGATPYTPDPGNTVNTGLLDIVDGALAVIAAGGTPTWAIIAPDVFKQIIATPTEDALKYFDFAIGLEGGTSDQGFGLVPDARLAPGTIIVGDRAGATAWELPGVPIRVSAPDISKGGIDEGFFGYIGAGVTTPATVVKNTGVAADPENGVSIEDGTKGALVDGVLESVIVAAEKSRK